NNLNDNRKPGKSDTWTPERMPSGTRIYKMGALNYSHETKDEWLSVNGHVTFEQTTRNNSTTTARTNFLSSGDTYENRYSRSYNRNAQLETRHYLNMHNDAIWGYAMAVGRYKTSDSHSDALSGSFSAEQKDMTLKALEALYTASTQETLDAVINRANTRSLGRSREYEVQFYPGFNWKLPKSGDRLSYEFGVKYNSKKETDWDDYTVNYGADPNPAIRKRQYRDGQPNHILTLIQNLNYGTTIRNVYLNFNYEYRFADRWRDSHSFALDRLADMGVFGVLPEGYTSAIDPDNSYTSHQMQNQHSLQVRGSWRAMFKNKSTLQILLAPEVRLLHDHMDYRRAGILYPIRHDFVNFSLGRYAAKIEYRWLPVGEGRRTRHVNTIVFDTKCTPKNPNLLDMVDVINDSDPLNISQGNPDLRPQHSYDISLKWTFRPDRPAHPLNNDISFSYSLVDDAIVRGYTYDTTTGVRHNRSYNLDGNHSYRASNYFSLQFGKGDCLSISSGTSADRSVYADMIGINAEAPTPSKVNNMIFSQGIDFAWNFGKQTLRLRVNVMTRHSSS
ncbi:MAG: outer membrane beta-barrel family protein, partial [Duncaniella sp.]|nr:outer membrane beta-barrel family protein [Duncaniella sp.]